MRSCDLKEALLYEKLEDNKVRCSTCYRRCLISEDKRGYCNTKVNFNGKLYSTIYGLVSDEAIEPIEKKPLYHFYPGSNVYSIGTFGCNLRCKYCQNWWISQARIRNGAAMSISPELAVEIALSSAQGIAWTYNEPAIWFEYTYDCAKLAKQSGLYTIYVTNGSLTPEALKLISPYLDAFRVDIKAMNEDFYKEVCSAKLEPVLENAKLAREIGLHVEVVNLLIPRKNDSEEEVESLAKWIRDNLGKTTPLHFLRFYPAYKFFYLYPTPLKTLERARGIAKQVGLDFVYIGNVRGHRFESTYCPNCNSLLIERAGPYIAFHNISLNKNCLNCKMEIPIRGTFINAVREEVLRNF